MENLRTRRKQHHNSMQSPLVLMATGVTDSGISENHNSWDYLRKRNRRPSHSFEKEPPPARSKPSLLRSCKKTNYSGDFYQKSDLTSNLGISQMRDFPASSHRNVNSDASIDDGMATDSFEPLSISKWLLSMKSPLTPLSPRSDTTEKTPVKPSQSGVRENIPSWLQTMKLPIAPLSPTEVSTPQNVLYPVWVPQGMSGVETVLPDSPSAPVALITKPMPEIVPSPAPSTAPEDLRNTTRPPPTVVVVPNETSYTEFCHVQDYSSAGSPRLCNLVTHRSNETSSGPLLATDKVEPETEPCANAEDKTERPKKKTRVTIEIETGGECIIFLPADRVEYRVIARKCPHCNDEEEDEVISSSRKPIVTVASKARPLI